eukprot:13627132-Alexandrium_andersonii.AAC.1
MRPWPDTASGSRLPCSRLQLIHTSLSPCAPSMAHLHGVMSLTCVVSTAQALATKVHMLLRWPRVLRVRRIPRRRCVLRRRSMA